MPALTLTCDNICLSYNYDGITIYYKTHNPYSFSSFSLAMSECSQLPFISRMDIDNVLDNIGFPFQFQGMDLVRYIHRDDDDHPFYHQDAYDMDCNHCHLKFSQILNRGDIQLILNILMNYGLISVYEKFNFLNKLDFRYQDTEEKLRKQLCGDAKTDLRTIVQFVHQCPDNDVLFHLHLFLSNTSELIYLRHAPNSNYQTCRNSMFYRCSEEWAMIEKALALQMARNIEQHCFFGSNVGTEQSRELERACSFFSPKRKTTAGASKSKMFAAFSRGDATQFDQIYEKHFNKFGR